MKINVTDYKSYTYVGNNVRLCLFSATKRSVKEYVYEKVDKRLWSKMSKKLSPAFYMTIDLDRRIYED